MKKLSFPNLRNLPPAIGLTLILLLGGILMPAVETEAAPLEARVKKQPFGRMPDGTPVDLYVLSNTRGLVAKVMTYGAILTELHVPDRSGALSNIVIGFDNLAQYLAGDPLFGAVVGHYANRIARARFQIDGVTYEVTRNAGRNHIHGGRHNFSKCIWQAEPVIASDGAAVKLTYVSADGEEGFPGKLTVTVVYTLTPNHELRLDYCVTTENPTVLRPGQKFHSTTAFRFSAR